MAAYRTRDLEPKTFKSSHLFELFTEHIAEERKREREKNVEITSNI